MLKAAAAAAAGPDLADQINLDRGILQVLTEYEEYRLHESVRARTNLFLLKVEFDLASFEPGIKELNAALKKIGEIIYAVSTAGGGAGISFSIVLGTTESREAVASTVTTPHATIEPVEYADGRRSEESRAEAGALKSVSNTVRVDIFRLDSLMNIVGEMHMIKNVKEGS